MGSSGMIFSDIWRLIMVFLEVNGVVELQLFNSVRTVAEPSGEFDCLQHWHQQEPKVSIHAKRNFSPRT